MPTPLIPQEIYLLERYSSLEYYGLARDAWEDMVKYVEACLERFMLNLPLDYRSRPLPEQPDIVWGGRALPNFHNTLRELNDGYIRLTHGDYVGLEAACCVRNDFTGQREFSYAWFDEVEAGGSAHYFKLLIRAVHYAGNIEPTAGSYWIKTALTTDYFEPGRGALDPPQAWPRYRVNLKVQVKTGDPVPRTGVYLPDIDDGCAQMLIAGKPAAPASVGYDSETTQNVSESPTLWTLVERVAGETVPLEHGLGTVDPLQQRVPAGENVPQSGWWFTPAQENSRCYIKLGDVFPSIEGSTYGATFWQWSPDQSSPKL